MKELAVIALGGNALLSSKEKFSIHQEIRNIQNTAKQIKKIIDSGYRVVITHGNGPQIGDMLIAQNAAKGKIPEMPLDILGAQTQGKLGYILQRVLSNVTGKNVNTLITQTIVDSKDPAFRNPTKFIGPFFKRPGRGLRKDSNRGYRKVVPSPEPLGIVEAETVKKLVKGGDIIVACGGGGVPVYRQRGKLYGIEAVVDKDAAAEALGSLLGAHTLLILTDIEGVFKGFGTKKQEFIRKMSAKEAVWLASEGHFAPGSMRPKVRACVKFIGNGGKRAVITSLDKAYSGLKARAGTEIVGK